MDKVPTLPIYSENGWTCPKCGYVNLLNNLKCANGCSLLESGVERPGQLNEG